MKKTIIIIILLITSLFVIIPENTYAKTTIDAPYVLTSNNSQDVNSYINSFKGNNSVYKQDSETCNSLLGDINDQNSVAWLLNKILDYIKILGPLAVIVLSGIEFTKAIINSDDDTMKKATSRLRTRLIMTGLLFMIPIVTQLLFQVFGIVSDCGLLK